MPWEHGSASQIQTYMSCSRKWWLKKIAGLDDSGSASTALGTEVHANIEAFLKGEGPLDHRLLSLNTFVPAVKASGHRLLIEHEFRALMDAPVVGYIDLVVVDEVNKIVHVWDHKTSKDWKWAKTEADLRSDPQCLLYLAVALDLYGPSYTYRFGHHVILTSAVEPQRTVSFEVSLDEIERGRATLNTWLRSMRQDADLVDGAMVEPTFGSCWAYGGCPFKDICKGNKPMPRLSDFKKSDQAIQAVAEAPVVRDPDRRGVVYVNAVPLNAKITTFSEWAEPVYAAYREEMREDPLATKYLQGVYAVVRELLKRDLPEHLVIRRGDPIGDHFASQLPSTVRVVQGI